MSCTEKVYHYLENVGYEEGFSDPYEFTEENDEYECNKYYSPVSEFVPYFKISENHLSSTLMDNSCLQNNFVDMNSNQKQNLSIFQESPNNAFIMSGNFNFENACI